MKLPSILLTNVLKYPRKNFLQVFLESEEFLRTINAVVKETVMRINLISSDQKKGIAPTLYHARLDFNQIKKCTICVKIEVSALEN